jgi:hypothetical protein
VPDFGTEGVESSPVREDGHSGARTLYPLSPGETDELVRLVNLEQPQTRGQEIVGGYGKIETRGSDR